MSRPTPPPILSVPPGRKFGPFVLVRKLAESGMAEVFLAKRVGPGGFERNVVIKRMLRHLSALEDFVDMFQDEASLAARLSHPNIIHIEEPGFADGYYYICMEYLAGEDFSTVLRRAAQEKRPVPLPVVLRVLVDAAHGLHHAHEFCDERGQPLGVVHRDVSPSNLFLSYQGQVKVLDFGIAKAESRDRHTTHGVVKGKYSYMAPEQARGEAVDRRADVFSLGVSLYEALTQVRPFQRDHALAVLNAVLAGEVTPPRELRPELPPELETIVLRAMSADPARRHPTAAAFAEELEGCAEAYAPLASSAQVGAYLRATFGEERVLRRSRIPTLATVLSAAEGHEDTALELPGGSAADRRGATAVLPPQDVPAEATALLPAAPPLPLGEGGGEGRGVERGPGAPEVSRVDAPAPARWRALVGGALAGGLLVAGAALVLGRPAADDAVRPQPEASPAPAPSAAAPQAPEPAPTVASAPTSSPAAAAAVAPVTPVVGAPVAAAQPARLEVARPARARPVVLDEDVIQRVVARGQARIMACFEKHKEDLAEDEGEVRVQFDVQGSGKVAARTLGPLAETGVGRCLEAQVQRLRFPAHRDAQVTAVQPFAYRVTR